MSDQAIKTLLYRTGHLLHPFGQAEKALDDLPEPPADPLDDLPDETVAKLGRLVLTDKDVKDAVRSYQHFLTPNLEPLILKHHASRRSAAPVIDGDIGPATRELFAQPRCGMADYAVAEEAVGSGQWRECHGVTGFHCAIIKVMTAIPAHMKRPYKDGTVWDEIKRRTRACYAEVGLRIYFSDDADCPDGNHQTEMSFVGSGAGWIGLALIGQGQQCQSNPIWMRVVLTYLQSSAISEDYLTLWANLVIHEFGHNTGSGHTSGGIMNPGILRVANRWIGDPAESRMKGWFGGVPVPIDDPDDDDDDNPPPPPGGTVHQIDEATLIISGKKLVLIGDLR